MSSSQNMSRKRPAPGTTPPGFPHQPHQAQNGFGNGAQPQMTDDQFLNWGADDQNSSAYTNSPMYNVPPSAYPSQSPTQTSNQLARRPINQVVTRQPPQTSQWMPEQPSTPVPQQDPGTSWSDDIDELVARAQVAKRDAQSKRKQIPPFVLKLHSFLENPKNTDLIRWSEDGKSFVVLNEDEFANKLIPELFKHNNYASFVRQLNMYGFHKKVGLSDNSMRASERKAKSPSEYFNPYFRRGYPDLLWLIQKPKNQPTGQKKPARGKSEEHEEDEDFAEDTNGIDVSRPRPQLAIGQGDRPLSTEQMQNVQRELAMIRRQQTQITQMLAQLKREHDALVDQANDYQNKHSRHEHSINAILTFLATLYNRSLQNHEGAQDIAKIFANTLANEKGNNSGVVDVDNFVYTVPEGSIDQAYQPHKRQRLMITDGTNNRANTLSPSAGNSPLPRLSRRSSHMARSPQSVHVEEIFDPEVNQPAQQNYQPPPGRQQQDDMMSLIHNTNAQNSGRNTPVPDFSHVLNNLESTGGTTPVSSAQRDNMIRMLNAQAQGSKRPQSSGSNGALVSPSRTNAQLAQFDQRINDSQQNLDHLAQLQAAQDKSVENLTNLLQPLSPSGSIPGLGDGQDVPPPPLNIDDFLGSHDYFANMQDDANGDYDFSNLNNAAYNQNMNTSNGAPGFDFADDDPLFADVDTNEVEDNNFLNASEHSRASDGNGRIESLASSSDAPTPRNVGSEDGEGTAVKGRRGS